ncbi:MAG: hypothetical protein H7Z17_09585 [Fuerstia sp.]|nr:hypothetical protein [Fuerstiella sp.]
MRRLVAALFFREFGSGIDIRLFCRLHLKLQRHILCLPTPTDENALLERQSGDKSPHSK